MLYGYYHIYLVLDDIKTPSTKSPRPVNELWRTVANCGSRAIRALAWLIGSTSIIMSMGLTKSVAHVGTVKQDAGRPRQFTVVEGRLHTRFKAVKENSRKSERFLRNDTRIKRLQSGNPRAVSPILVRTGPRMHHDLYSRAHGALRVMPKSSSLPVSSSYTKPWTRTSFLAVQARWIMLVWTTFSTCLFTDSRT